MVRKTKSKARVVKGTHLTITTDEHGHMTFEWDWDQLSKEIVAAIATLDKPKKKRTKKVPEVK